MAGTESNSDFESTGSEGDEEVHVRAPISVNEARVTPRPIWMYRKVSSVKESFILTRIFILIVIKFGCS